MEVKISVRSLVEFILRSGNIDNRRAASPDNAMQEGSRIHRMIQRRMGSEYHAEVSLKYVYDAGQYKILVEGRADGIITENTADTVKQAIEENEPQISLAIGTIGTDKDTERNIRGDTQEKIEENQYVYALEPVRFEQWSQRVTVTIDEIKGVFRDIKK